MIEFTYANGATPIDQGEAEGLIPGHVTTQQQLNEFEQANILKAYDWISSKKSIYEAILTVDLIKELHKKMLGDTWRWAGKFRKSDKNIGAARHSINEELKKLLDDTKYQIEHNTYPYEEIEYRFHHRLVKIHLFPNGNGRHARLITDKLLDCLDEEAFSWGGSNLIDANKTREDYIKVLKAADVGDYTLLKAFVRS